MEGTQFRYVIKFVTDMNKAVKFYRDTLGLQLRFESPSWSEFATGETTLALHPASDQNPAGKVEFGFTVADVEAFYRDMSDRHMSVPHNTPALKLPTRDTGHVQGFTVPPPF